MTAVQLCCAHLLRAMRGLGKLDPDRDKTQRCWTEPATQALLDANAAVPRPGADGATALDPDLLADLSERYDKGHRLGHRHQPAQGTGPRPHPGYTPRQAATRRAGQVWRFAVPFANHPAERPQRMVKRRMKTAAEGATYAPPPDTAATFLPGHRRNHGIHPLDALRDVLAGNP